MARVQIDEPVLDPQGRLLAYAPDTTVNVLELDGTTATIYQAETGSATYMQPLSLTYGRVESSDAPGQPVWVEARPYRLTGTLTDGRSFDRRFEAGAATGTVSARAFGPVGLGVVDDTTRLGNFLNALGDRIGNVPAGVYLLTSGVLKQLSRSTVICHRDAIFKPQGNDHAIQFDSPTPRTPTTTYALTADTTVGAVTVTVSTANAANFTAGDRITLRDPTYALNGENCRRETNTVQSVNTGTGVITLDRPIGHVYTTADSAWIAKVTTAVSATWIGGTFDMTGVAGGIAADCDAIYGNWPEACLVQDVTVHNHPDKGVDYHGGLDSTIRNCNAYAPSRDGAGEAYNMRVHYSRDCLIEGGWSRNVRHHADISGGQSCHIRNGVSSGRTTTTQCGAFLHGLESRWCTIRGFVGHNMNVAVGAGNGSFGADFDFTIDGSGYGCDKGVFLAQGCQRGTIRGRYAYCTERGFVNDNSTDMDVDVEVTGNLSTSNASATISGASSGKFRFRVRNPAWKGVTVTTTTGAGRIVLENPDIDMGSTAQNAIEATQGVSGAEVTLEGAGRIVMASSTNIGFLVNGAYDLGGVFGRVRFVGQMLRCAAFDGGCKRVRAMGVVPALTNTAAEAVRVDTVGDSSLADTEAVVITGNAFVRVPSGTSIRIAGPVTTSGGSPGGVAIGGNFHGLVTTQVNNSAGARTSAVFV